MEAPASASVSASAAPPATSRVLPGVPTATASASDPGMPADTDAAVPAASVWGQVDAVRLPIPKGVDPMRARPDRKGQRGR